MAKTFARKLSSWGRMRCPRPWRGRKATRRPSSEPTIRLSDGGPNGVGDGHLADVREPVHLVEAGAPDDADLGPLSHPRLLSAVSAAARGRPEANRDTMPSRSGRANAGRSMPSTSPRSRRIAASRPSPRSPPSSGSRFSRPRFGRARGSRRRPGWARSSRAASPRGAGPASATSCGRARTPGSSTSSSRASTWSSSARGSGRHPTASAGPPCPTRDAARGAGGGARGLGHVRLGRARGGRLPRPDGRHARGRVAGGRVGGGEHRGARLQHRDGSRDPRGEGAALRPRPRGPELRRERPRAPQLHRRATRRPLAPAVLPAGLRPGAPRGASPRPGRGSWVSPPRCAASARRTSTACRAATGASWAARPGAPRWSRLARALARARVRGRRPRPPRGVRLRAGHRPGAGLPPRRDRRRRCAPGPASTGPRTSSSRRSP